MCGWRAGVEGKTTLVITLYLYVMNISDLVFKIYVFVKCKLLYHIAVHNIYVNENVVILKPINIY